MNLGLALVLGYSVVLILLGLGIGRAVQSTGAFFVAGRKLSPALLFSTLLAANIGAGSTVGAAAIGYTYGLRAWWWVGSAGIGSLILAFWIGPRIWRLASDHDFHTVGDLLELRYGKATRALVSALLWVATLFALASQLIAIASILQAVAGIPKVVGCLLGGLVMTSYFAAGGLLSSAWVNMVQLVVLAIGFALALPMALSTVGGLGGLFAQASSLSPTGYGEFWILGPPGMAYVAMLVPAFIVSPGLLQKVYGARDEHCVRLGVALNGLVLLFFAFIPTLLGMTARVYFPNLASPDLALSQILIEGLPLWLGGLGLAAVFSAELSSADAILFMLATSLSRDLYRRFLRPKASDEEVLRVARAAAVSGGILGVVIALAFETVIGALTVFYSIMSVSLFVPIVAGLHLSGTTTRQAMAAIVPGISVLLAVHLSTEGAGYGALTPTLAGLLSSIVCFFLARIFFGHDQSDSSTAQHS